MAEEFKGKHVVIFSRSCLLLSSEERQQQMNDEIDALSKNGNFKLHFTSHQNPTSEMLGAIPKGYVYYSHFRVLCWYQPFSRTRPQEPRSRPSYYNRGQKLWRLCASLHFTPNSISLTIGCTILEIPSSCAPPPPPPISSYSMLEETSPLLLWKIQHWWGGGGDLRSEATIPTVLSMIVVCLNSRNAAKGKGDVQVCLP